MGGFPGAACRGLLGTEQRDEVGVVVDWVFVEDDVVLLTEVRVIVI